ACARDSCSRRCATIRRPRSSNRALIFPVRLRRVASGLMIDNVRSMAMLGGAPENCDRKLRGVIATSVRAGNRGKCRASAQRFYGSRPCGKCGANGVRWFEVHAGVAERHPLKALAEQSAHMRRSAVVVPREGSEAFLFEADVPEVQP